MIDRASLAGLQLAARYRGLRKVLRRQAIGAFIFGALAVVVGLIGLQFASINVIVLLIGAALLVLGVLALVQPRPWLLMAEGIVLIILAAWNVVVTALNRAAGGPGGLIWIVIIQLLIGVSLIKRYRDYADTPTEPPPADMLAWLDQTATAIRKTNLDQSPYVIQWAANRGGWGSTRWRAQLAPDLATVVDAAGSEVFLLTHDQFILTKGRKLWFGKSFYLTAQLGPITMKGSIAPDQFERYQAWRLAGTRPGTGQGIWVPQA